MHNDAHGGAMGSLGALAGVRVLDFSQAWAGPLCARTLADMGADVLKVESASVIDVARTLGPFLGAASPDTSGYFLEWNRGKRSVCLDLKTDAGRATALRLVESADVVVENFAPGVMERLGVGFKALCKVNPDVVMVSISGFGATGPASKHVAFGQQIEAVSGLMSLMTYEDGLPTKTGISWSDPVAGFFGAMAAIAALENRDATGDGSWLEVSMLEATLSIMLKPFALLAAGLDPQEAFRGGRSPDCAPSGVFRAIGDDRWVAIACQSDEDWIRLSSLMGLGWDGDERYRTRSQRLANRESLNREIEEWTRVRDAAEIASLLQARGIPAHHLVGIADLLTDDHLQERQFWIDVVHSAAGPVRTAGSGVPVTQAVRAKMLAAPMLGSSVDWDEAP